MRAFEARVLLALTLLGAGCGDDAAGAADTTALPPWAKGDAADAALPQDSTAADTDTLASADAPASIDTVADAAAPPDAIALDVASTGAHPKLAVLPLVTLKMGESTTLDLGDHVTDLDDPLLALTVSFSTQHVAMTDTTGHRLLIVAPSDWFGNEVVPITVKDPKGNADTEALTVQVQQAELPKPPDPPPPDTCGIVELSVDTGSASLVLVAGTFNDWATTPEKAIKLFDPDGDGVFATTLVLEPGAYQYKFIVDGAWKEDPTNPETAPDGYGGVNSVLVVPPCD